MKEKESGLQMLAKLISREKREVTAIYFFSILSGMLQLSVPVGIQAIIGFVMGANMVTSIYVLIAVVVLGVFLVGIMQINQMRLVEKIQQKIFTYYALEFTEAIPRFSLKKIDNYYLPEKANRFFDTVILQKSFSKLLLDIPQASIQIILGLILLSLYHPIFIAFSLFLLFILWLIFKLTGKRGIATSLAESNFKYDVVDWIEEISRVIASFKFSQGSHLNLRKTDKNVVNYLNSRNSHFRVLLFQYKTLLVLKVIITASMLIAGTILLLDQKLNIGEFIAAEIVILTIIGAVEKLISNLDSVYDVMTSLDKLTTFIDMEKEMEGKVLVDQQTEGMSIRMEHFSYAHNNKQFALNDIDLVIPANNKVNLMGKEGSGKSTFLQLLSGSFQEFEGHLILNNIPIINYKLSSLRNRIGYFSPKPSIFKGSVMENISLSRSEITPESIYKLAHDLGFEQVLFKLPDGLETEIASEGHKLSSSAIHKLMLLRALINNPILLLLDEPWQGLDIKEQKQLAHYLIHHLPHTTVLVVGQQEDYFNQCNSRIELHNGELINP